ncbi:hypothetical protein C8J56DRAFT_1053976 [Mycena floridula]|nr:hypothetical protein C8J56DRAFT_1053976 [Mycena floridula]
MYARVKVAAEGKVVFFLLLKGNDLHSGSSPSINSDALQSFLNFLNEHMRYAGCENRAVLIPYPNHAAFYKDTPCTVWENLGFGNRTMVTESYHTYVQDGYPLLGPYTDYMNRIWREGYMMQYNAARDLGLEPSRDRPFYKDLNKVQHQMRPLSFDPEYNADKVHELRSMAIHQEENSSFYLLSMTKPMFREAQAKATAEFELSIAAPAQATGTNPKPEKTSTKGPICQKSQGGSEEDEIDDGKQDEISHILDKKVKDGIVMYKVRWSGYRAEFDEWVNVSQMDANELISEYEKRAAPPSVPVVPSDAFQINIDSRSFHTLKNLVDIENLQAECTKLEHASSGTLSSPLTIARCNEIFRAADTFQATSNVYGDSGHFHSLDISAAILHLNSAVTVIVDSFQTELQLNVALHSIIYSRSRALLFVYQWFTLYGPQLAADLFTPRRDNPAQSLAFFPTHAPLVHHLMDWIEAWAVYRSQQNSQRLKRSRLNGTAAEPHPKPDDTLVLSQSLLSPLQISEDITISWPKHAKVETKEDQQEFGQNLWLDIISTHLILSKMEKVDADVGGSQGGNKLANVKDRCIIRGAILDLLVDTIDDDGILASESLEGLLKTPAPLFLGGKKKNPVTNRQLAARILDDPSCLHPLISWLYNNCDIGDLHDTTMSLAEAVHDGMEHLTKVKAIRSTSTKRLQGKLRNCSDWKRAEPSVPLFTLCPWNDGPFFGKLSCMLREVLHAARGEPHWDTRLYNILQGDEPNIRHHSRSHKDGDHFTPIRFNNRFQTLLHESLGNNDIRGPYGLSNLLVHIGTGQGNRTSDFLQRHLNVWLTSSTQTTRIFDAVWNRNRQPTCHKPMKFDNPQCWGQFCSAFSLMHQKPDQHLRPDFEKRFDPMFAPGIVSMWQKFLDPATYTGDPTYRDRKPSYSHALKLSKDTGISGFGSGIT